MNKQFLLHLVFFLFSTVSFSQSQLIIHYPAKDSLRAKQISILDLPDLRPLRPNDSTLVFNYQVTTPLYFMILLDEATLWGERLWAGPGDTKRIIRVNYAAHTSYIVNPTPTDQFLDEWCAIFNARKQAEADAGAEKYIRTHPNDYISLWMLTHGAFRSDKAGRERAFKLLDPALARYTPYKELKQDVEQRRIPKKGEAFREFELSTQANRLFDSKSVHDKIILLQFWSNSCGPCVKGMDDLVKLYKSLDTSKIQFISISLDEEKEKWQRSPVSRKIVWTSLWQENNLRCDLCLHYNLSAIPLFVLFSPDKKLHEIIEGEQLAGIQNELSALLENSRH